MKILIVEDEELAVKKIRKTLAGVEPDAEVVAVTDSILSTVNWLEENQAPDLILMDIELSDGQSFEIFNQTTIKSPVIFTTSYDEYALKAFKVNSIDYILKPVDRDELAGALKKWSMLGKNDPGQKLLLDNIGQAIQMLMKKYKTRFVIKVGEHLRTVEVSSIRYFYSQEKATFCSTDENRNFILDYTLEQLEEMTDPAEFYRINRKYLVRSGAIQDIISFTNSRLKLVLKGSQDNDIIVARERVQDFKQWLDR